MPDKVVVYLSGPMSGHEAWNFPAFDAAAAELRGAGYRVINPADFGADPRFTWADCIARDLGLLAFAKVVAQMPGWEASRGASLEAHTAQAMGIPVVSLAQLLSPSATPPVIPDPI